nr:MAG TPA: pentapeptide repeat protein [Caudoviricetes sp.]
MEKVKGYKVFDPDFTCRDFQYEVGKTYKHKGSIGLCEAGFHFCSQLKDCFNYYSFNPDNKVAEIVASGEVIVGDGKSVTNTIKIVREISWSEVLELVNTGKANTGLCNTGNCNTGNCNTGNWNTGNWNTGDWNTGDRNTGLFNSCNYSNGLFNSKSPKIYMFNKPTKLTYEELQEKHPEAYNLLYYSSFKLTEWIPDYNMSDEEKTAHPEYKTIGGYLKRNGFKEVCQKMWDSFSKTERNKIKKLPNFDRDIFKKITGIEV